MPNNMPNNTFYNNQVITYLGNKRTLLKDIESTVKSIIKANFSPEKQDNLIIADLFSGSGVVSRMLKTYSRKLIVNDFEPYTKVINSCYLTNKADFNEDKYDEYLQQIENYEPITDGIIRTHYSPKDDTKIQPQDRCFYTNINAKKIDTYRAAIQKIVPPDMQKFYLASLLYEASVHVNTGGMFKGFYKDRHTKIGKFGGTNSDSLARIKGEIKLSKPILSDSDAIVEIYCEDTNKLITSLEDRIDIAYIDSPYNQHPYGSNYFMLNLILENKITDINKLSRVSGIPNNWKDSDYYKRAKAETAMRELISNLKASWIIVSYSSDGIIGYDEMIKILEENGTVDIKKIQYPLLKSSRNRKENKKELTEYIFILRKFKIC